MGIEPTLSAWKAEVLPLNYARIKTNEHGVPGEIRTPDLLIRSQALYPAELRAQMSWWAHQDSNLGPTGYEPAALTN